MKKDRALKAFVNKRPMPGGKIILLGFLVLLVWAVWECAVRLDAMDGMTQAYFNLVKQGKITFGEAVENIWNTPEARKDWINPLVLMAIAVFSLFGMLFCSSWKLSVFMYIPACVCILLFKTTNSLLLSLLNLFEVIKYAGVILVAGGSSVNAITAFNRRRQYHKRLAERKKKNASALEARKNRTLIPPKTGTRG